jgi:FMN phosphatase YigB (HAD superfamily)
LTSKQVNSLTQQWESAYGGYAGTVFDESVTGTEPFQWMLRSTLPPILSSMKITVTDAEFEALIACWGNLVPWTGTTETLQKVFDAGYHIGTLSNGDQGTLKNAMSIFTGVKFSYYFSSDFPNAGSFKPDHAMYDQLPRLSSYSVEEILHVAGANSDGWGARSAGLYSALVGSPPYPKQPLPCFLLKDITELTTVLGI